MATRMAGGGWRAARALGLLMAWSALVCASTLHAQQYHSTPHVDAGYGDGFDADGYDDGSGYGCGDCCDDCSGSHMPDSACLFGCGGDGQQWWFGADYLVWRIDGSRLPPLVTDSSISNVPALGLSTTRVIAGANNTAESWRSGYRLRAGFWLDECHDLAITGDYFQLGDDDYNFYYAGDSGRNTGRPFFNTQSGTQDVRLISVPTLFDGTISVATDDDFQGAGLALEQSVYAIGDVSGCGPGTQLILIGGYRYYGYDSRLAISDSRTTLSGAQAGDQSLKRDDFSTSNEFHGGQFGALVRFTQQSCWFDGLAKIAVGGQRSSVTISGETVTIPAGMVAQTAEGGLLTSSETNIGHYSDTRARVIPEFRVGFGVYLTPNWSVRAGYSVVAWSGVARPAGQMPPNLAVDQRNLPPVSAGGGASPLFPGIGTSNLVADGIDLAVEFTY